MKRTIVTSTILVLAAVQLGLATTPATITYQGVLKDDKGDIVADGSYSVTFRLYDAEVGGTNVGSWTETHSVATTDGVFSVELGTQMSLVTGGKFDIPYWLEIEVGGVALTPRTELTAVPYAMAARAVRGSWNELASRGRLGINVVGTADTTKAIVLTDEGRVGIGTTQPTAKLHVMAPNSDGIIMYDSTSGTYRASLINFENTGGSMFLNDVDGNAQARIRGYAYNGIQAYFTAGKVGIGTNMPSTNLEVVGTVMADTLMLATAAERYYAIPHHQFHSTTGYSRTDFNTYSNSASSSVTFEAPVHLPHGASITQFKAAMGDTIAGNVTLDLRAYSFTGSWWQIAQVTSNGVGLTMDSSAISPGHVVDNESRAYYIKATWWTPNWGGNYNPNDTYIRGARVKYTVDEPLP